MALAAAVLLMPTVLAEPGSGQMLVEGPIQLPSGASVEGIPLAAFSSNMSSLTRMSLEAGTVRVIEASQSSTVLPTPGEAEVSWPTVLNRSTLTHVRIDLASSGSDGWIGVYPSETACVLFEFGLPSGIEPRQTSEVGEDGNDLDSVARAYDAAFGETRPNSHRYQRVVASPHVFSEAPGRATFTGPLVLKVFGPDLRLQSDEREGLLVTGASSRGSSDTREDVRTWVLLEIDQGELVVETRAPLVLALEDPTVTWSGAATFSAVSGELRTATATYVTTGRHVSLVGDFTASLVPEARPDGMLVRVTLDGTLRATTLRPESATVAGVAADSGSWWLWGLGGLATVMVGGTGIILLRRSRVMGGRGPAAGIAAAPAKPPVQPVLGILPVDDGLQADDCIRFADDAAVERRWARALHWARRARELAPQNARIRADEGEYLFQLGMFEEALAAFTEASRLDSEEGYADYRGAQAAAAAGRPVDEVLGWLHRALDRSPDLVGDLELFREFDGLRGMPEYDAMVRTAYERLGIDPANPF